MTFQELREKALSLPLLPGVYIMMDKSGKVIYVGKAKALKNRVSSYFHETGHNAKTAAMVSKIYSFDTIVVGSEFEAFVTENSLIKHHKPYYNILLKDDKGYPYLRVDLKKEYPTFSVVGRAGSDGATYLGPYQGRTKLHEALDTVCKALKLPTCGKRFPADIGKERPCLNFHMGLCSGYCTGTPDAEAYRNTIREAILLLEGRSSELTEKIKIDMEAAAGELKFELAAELRDRMKAIDAVGRRGIPVSGSAADNDVIGYYRGAAKACFVALHNIGGRLLDKEQIIFDVPVEDDAEALTGLLLQYYSTRRACPREVCIPFEIEDVDALASILSETYGRKIRVYVPQWGEKARLVSLASVNAREECERATDSEERISKVLELLAKTLGLEGPPERIEAYDISNTGSDEMVGAMTVFVRSRPLKRDWRQFKIKTLDSPDDYHSMHEVLERRIAHTLADDGKFPPFPQLMLMDGGQAHAAMARDTIAEHGLNIPVFGMVKDDRHRTRALVSPDGEEIGLEANQALFSLIGRIQEETHKSAISFHRKRRDAVGSSLDKIPGIGETRRNALLKHFGSIKAVRSASLEELGAVVPKNAAAAVFGFFHGGEEKGK